jgi:hypothetical protein
MKTGFEYTSKSLRNRAKAAKDKGFHPFSRRQITSLSL